MAVSGTVKASSKASNTVVYCSCKEPIHH